MASLRLSLVLVLLLATAVGPGRAQTVSGKPVPRVPDADGWFGLFNGRDLSAWMTFDPGVWSVGSSGELRSVAAFRQHFIPGFCIARDRVFR